MKAGREQSEALRKWSGAVNLRVTASLDKWQAVFPDAQTLDLFLGEVSHLQIDPCPWEDAVELAERVRGGFNAGQAGAYSAHLRAGLSDALPMVLLIEHYGRCLPPLVAMNKFHAIANREWEYGNTKASDKACIEAARIRATL